jgi:hypothetical protein
VFVEADLGFWRSRELFEQLRFKLRDRFSLDSARFLFGVSHTHSSVSLTDSDPALPGGSLLGPYIAHIEHAAQHAIETALQNAEEAVLDWRYGRCALASNRDVPDPNPGSTRVLCGYNPNISADDTLIVGRVTSQSGKMLAAIVNYACHPTTLGWENSAISPDFVGAMRETIESATGTTALFVQGASGELAPRYQYVGDPQVADRHGRHLGYACLAVLEDMDPPGKLLSFERVVESGAPLAVWRYEKAIPSTELDASELRVELPIKNWPTVAELEKQLSATAEREVQERLRRQQDTRRALGDGETFTHSLWIWRIGNAVLVGVPEEPYSVLQMELRQRFCSIPIICVNLVNNRVGGYLPPQDLYELDIYQVWRTPFARGSLEIVISALASGIEQIITGESKPQSFSTAIRSNS